MRRCADTFRGYRCTLQAGHVELHVNGEHQWGFRDLEPEWVKRAKTGRLPFRDMTNVR